MFLVYSDMFAQPYATCTSPCPVVLVYHRPLAVVALCVGISWVGLVQHCLPLVVGSTVGLHLGAYVVVALVYFHLLNQHRIVGLQRILAYPCLDGGAAPAVYDYALSHLILLKHLLAQEITYCREWPCVLLVEWLPVDAGGANVVFYTMCAGLILYTEQADVGILVVVYLGSVLRVNTLYMYINVRLARKQPHIAYHDVINCLFVDCHLIRAASFHLWQVYSPSTIGIGCGLILFLVESYGNGFASIGFTPNGYGLTALHHHARLE